MFTSKICLATLLLSLHAANSYILLTANLDDVHSLAKQLAESPVVKDLNEFIRRASSTFNEELPDVRKHNVDPIKTRSEPQLVEKQAQIFRAHDSNEKTDRFLPLPIMDKKSDAAPANNKDNVDVWTPDKKGSNLDAAPANNKDNVDVWTPDKKGSNLDAAPANDKDNLDVWTPDKKAVADELNEKSSGSSSESENNDIKFKPNYKMRRTVDDDIVKLGRNASFYLTSIKKIFENV